MRKVKCKSGLMGWRARLQENYKSKHSWRGYSNLYGLANKLGYASATAAWLENPVVEGSVDPSDFRVVKTRKKKSID